MKSPEHAKDVETLIAELGRWRDNRSKASARRTHGPALTSEPLEKAIHHLSNYLKVLRKEKDGR